jgi:hypothetical protein
VNRAQLATLATEIEQSRPTPEWDSVPELKKFKQELIIKGGEKKRFTFDQLVSRYKEIDAEIKFRESKKAEVKEAIEAAMLLSDESSVLAEGYKVNLVTKQGNRKIVAEKLLGAGVSADVIARCTDVSAPSTYVSISRAKDQ